MTKEELYYRVSNHNSYLTTYLDSFFSQNVVIPKGKNRHPYADILHEWVEGADLQYKNIDGWHDIKHIKLNHQAHEYRIKPKEPVYEWQWVLFGKDEKDYCGGLLKSGDYMTEDEAFKHYSEHINTKVYEPEKIARTKRERK